MPFSLLSADGQSKYDVRDGAPMLVGRAPTCDVPVFDPTDKPTSTWGGTMIGITKACRTPDLAWKLIEYLYFSDDGIRWVKPVLGLAEGPTGFRPAPGEPGSQRSRAAAPRSRRTTPICQAGSRTSRNANNTNGSTAATVQNKNARKERFAMRGAVPFNCDK